MIATRKKRPRFRTPWRIEFRDRMQGDPKPPPNTFYKRFFRVLPVFSEMWTGQLYVHEETKTPSVWICAYCCAVNYEFERRQRQLQFFAFFCRFFVCVKNEI